MEYFLIYALYVLIFSILMGVSSWKMFQKMGYSPMMAFVPFYNYYIVLKETENPRWWVIFAYFPIVGTIMMSAFHILLMEKFGKDTLGQKLLTIFLPFIYMASVNYSSDLYVMKNTEESKKETFLGTLVYSAVFATLFHYFLAQPFTIPTGSMERTLLVGDFLFVNRWSYGLRLPMRPLSIPFLQNTIFDKNNDGNPKNDPKSYVEGVKLPYFRIPALGKVERNDIVVFNYPDDSVHIAIDRKDPYVKRAVAVAGDVLEIKEGKLFINGKREQIKGDAEVQQAYNITTSSQLDIPSLYKVYGFLPVKEYQTNGGYFYEFSGLTDKIVREFRENNEVLSVSRVKDFPSMADVKHFVDIAKSQELQRYVYTDKINEPYSIFPLNKNWNKDWYGPLRIPKKGDIIELNEESLPMYRKLITEFEGNSLEEKGNQIFVNGELVTQYEVKQDYYFMMGDNRDASLDSRYFGFVPETHIVGSPLFTWMSLQGVFSGDSDYKAPFKMRFERMFKITNTGEVDKTSYWWIALILAVLFFGWEYFVGFFKKEK